jgi:hypothetical protein
MNPAAITKEMIEAPEGGVARQGSPQEVPAPVSEETGTEPGNGEEGEKAN